MLKLYVRKLFGDCGKIPMDMSIKWKRFLWFLFIAVNMNFYVPPINRDLNDLKATSNIDMIENNLAEKNHRNIESSAADSQLFENNTIGFRVLSPDNKTFFNSFPKLKFEILNVSLIESNDYQVSISNLSDNANWVTFDPFNSLEIKDLLNLTLLEKWDQTKEAIPIFIHFFVELNDSRYFTYSVNITKDFHAPSFEFGFKLTPDNKIVKISGNTYFTTSPRLYLWISDNVANEVDIFFTVNNLKYVESGYANSLTTMYFNGSMSSIILKDFMNMPEGQNYIYIYVNDTAGNPTKSSEVSFFKDTISPKFDSGDLGKYWVRNGNESFEKFYNPIYNAYEFDERPALSFIFKDTDISRLKIHINLTRNRLNLSPYYVENENSSTDFIFLIPIQIAEGEYYLLLPDQVWDALDKNDLLLRLELEDRAGNINERTLKISRIASQSSQLSTFIIFLILLGIIVITIVFTFLYAPIHDKLWKRHNPLEGDLKTIDPGLLDVVLPPLDQAKTNRLLEYSSTNGQNLQVTGAIPPDIEELLTSPMQLVDLDEIRTLLTKFKMDSFQQEEFIREMVALSPDERVEFIQNFMSDQDDDYFDDLTNDDDFF